MKLTRRDLLRSAAASAVTARAAAAAGAMPTSGSALPAKALFAPMNPINLDAGSFHPISLGAQAALADYLSFRSGAAPPPGYSMNAKEQAVLSACAALIGADVDELCLTQSTTMGENLVIQALDMPRSGGRIVTDVLHFFGSMYTYGELAKAGMDVVWLRMTAEGRIDMRQMAAAIDGRTRLVSVSLVSTINGFQHDLKKICDIAHAHGAYVYADIIHAVGTVPVDLHASGVDFAATSSYKWLMGDFGLGFLYVRKEVQRKIRRPWWGYHQLAKFATHAFPHDEPGPTVADYAASPDASGMFAMGTTSWTGVVQLEHSLAWLNRVGVAAIQSWRQPMIDAVQKELRRRGYEPLTPEDSKTAMVAFALEDAPAKLAERMNAAGIRLTISRNRFRVSVAVFNDMNDIDRLLAALPKSPP